MSQNSSRNKWMAITIGVLCFVTLIAFVFAFLQQAEAKRITTMAIECERNSMQRQQQLEATIENLRLAVIDAQQQKDQAQKKLK
jgi:hypothetical protein